jgi:hypothetical protein
MTTNGGNSGEEIELECAVIVEYGTALAAAAERCLRYPDRLQQARSRDERDHIRAEHRGFIRRTIAANTIALAVLGDEPSSVNERNEP